jgi:TPR repeat protein
MYFKGLDVEADPEQSFAWLNAAARQEDDFALDLLADFYMRGVVTKQDREFAKRLMTRAAELGNTDSARVAYVMMTARSAKEPRDPRLAIHFLTKAAKGNDARACYLLAREYLRGTNVQHDPAAAAHWLQRSSEGGNALGSLWLSELHFKGFGVTRDSSKAEQLLSDALPRASMQEKNQFAWDLSVNDDERLRDGLLAVRVLEPALTAATEKVTMHVDTLAAAYAEVKQFDRAVVTQISAIERAKRESRPQEMIAEMMARLRLYESRQPYRELKP